MNKEIMNELFDKNTFVQINSYLKSPVSDGIDAGDGVITGYGSVNGRAVFAAVQDEDVLNGAVGISHAKKITACIDMAVKAGSPFILFINTAGARINEGLEVLAEYGNIIKSLSSAIGIIPTISVITGKCTGVSSVIASMTDFAIMSDDAYFAFSGTDSLAATTLNDIKSVCNSAGASKLGKVSHVATDLKDCFNKVKELLDYIPDNCQSGVVETESSDDFNRGINTSEFDTFSNYDVKNLISQIADNSSYFELYKDYAPNVFTGFAHIGNKAVCIIANQPAVDEGVLNSAACNKISTILAFCDKFSIPVVTLTNTAGFAVSVEEENAGISAQAALLAASFTNSDITKINIITGKAYGSSYIVMNGKNTGSDIVYAWNTADISLITPEAGALLMYNSEIKSAADPVEARNEYIAKYRSEYSTPIYAAHKGLVDDVISPAETRARIISALYLFN